MDKQREQEAQAIIERAQAYKGLITVLTLRLEQSDDLSVKSAVAELRQDRDWQIFTRGIIWYTQRKRKNERTKTGW